MCILRNMPIGRKLTAITLLTSGVALLLACVAFVAYEAVVIRWSMVADLSSTAKMVGYNSAAALSFNDPASAAETLRSLTARPHVVGGAIYDKHGKLFATYQSAALKEVFTPPAAEPDSHRYTGHSLRLFREIVLAGEHTGTVYIESNLDEIYARLQRYALIILAVLVVASFVAYLLSSRLQTVISGPISHLAGVVGAVATEKDYSVRAVKRGEDELGQLIDGFNNMLAQIQARDNMLRQARDQLDQRVQQRTAELSAEVAERKRAEGAVQRSYDGQAALNQLLRMSQEELPLNRILEQCLDLLFAIPWLSATECGAVFIVEGDPGVLVLKAQRGLNPALLHAGARVPFGSSLCDRAAATGQVVYADALDDRHETRHDGILPHGHYCVPITAGKQTLGVLNLYIEAGHIRDVREENFLKAIADTLAGIIQRTRAQTHLEIMQKALMSASREAGMTEIAANVLHNVGNALTSANISLALVVDGAKNIKAPSLAKVVALMREHAGDIGTFITSDPRGKQLPAFLAQLSDALLADQKAILYELDLLQGYVKHIIEIVAMQQSYAKVSGVKEEVDVNNLIEDSLRMNAGALNRHGVEIIREYENIPLMNLDKHKLLQILVNLVRNAKYACEDSGRKDKRLILRVTVADGKLRVSVIDNGIGIPPENLTRIFSHGFTTRKGGHGFGLHGSALAVKEMGGSLSVVSDGPGQGAAFTLELPCETSEIKHE